jgi:uncharacterized protein (DUF2235 family)
MDYKNIVICSDGTGNTTIKGRGTNVFKLFEAVDVNGHRTDPRLRRQLTFYDDGVGTQELRWIRAFAGATGYGLSRNVKRLYRELCRVYEPGDDIYLFGFSRGAFTVRTLAGLIADCGIISPAEYSTEREFRAQARAAYKAYRRKYGALLTRMLPRHGMTADEFRARYARRDHDGQPLRPRIRLLGVWDTVDAVGLPFRLADFWNSVIWQFKFKTTTLSDIVDKGCHALALNDDRGSFRPVLWNEPADSPNTHIEQVWFAGAHSNVGGGYPQQGMSLVALDWMMAKAEAEGLRFNAVARGQFRTQHAFADRLYNPRAGLGTFYRWKPRNVRQLCAEKGIAVPQIHLSAIERIIQAPEGYAPGNIPPHCDIVATEDEPLIDEAAIARAIAAAHGGADAPSLIERQTAWVRVGFTAYLTFITGMAGAALRALWVAVGDASSVGALASTFSEIQSMPVKLALAAGQDSIAAPMLAAGLVLGYILSDLSDRRTTQVYSAFWHQHRPALREATRRTPAPPPGSTAGRAPAGRQERHGLAQT